MDGMICFLSGFAASTVVWFLVWRNNQKKFKKVLDKLNDVLQRTNG
jgi:preprotein translocase subunit YajC